MRGRCLSGLGEGGDVEPHPRATQLHWIPPRFWQDGATRRQESRALGPLRVGLVDFPWGGGGQSGSEKVGGMALSQSHTQLLTFPESSQTATPWPT